ncbi:hypothetical protein D3C71_1445830 [compost metagenome]
MPVAQQQRVGAQGAAQAAFHAVGGRACLLQAAVHQRQPRHGGHGHHPEDAAPARERNHPAARQRRQDGRHAEHQDQQRHQPRCIGARVQVAHHGTRYGHARRRAQTLQKAQGHQGFDVTGQRTPHAGHREQAQAKVQRRLAPHHVGDRAVEQLASPQRQEKRRQAPLHSAHRCPQAGANIGQRGQVHVDGKGADGREQAQDEGHFEEAGKMHSRPLSPFRCMRFG